VGKDVYWNLELAVKPGELDNVKALMSEMVESANTNEPGTLSYEWSFSEDGKSCHIFERYTDSAAVMTHLGTFKEKFMERFLAAMEPERLLVYGNPSDEAKEALSGFGAVFMLPIGGFTR
jgi:quinol monooxygenase YgiN